jgi:hypothetical protein
LNAQEPFVSRTRTGLAILLILAGCHSQDPLSYTLYLGSRANNLREAWATFDASAGRSQDAMSDNKRNCELAALALNSRLHAEDARKFWCEAAPYHS